MGFRDTGNLPFYFQGYGILCSMFWLLSGILNTVFWKNNYGDICQFIRDTCLFTYLVPPLYKPQNLFKKAYGEKLIY